MRHRVIVVVACSMLALGVGCGGGSPSESNSGTDHSPVAPGVAQAKKPEREAQPAGAKAEAAPEQPISRKIIYSAHVEVVVKELDDTIKAVERIIESHKGYVASSETLGSAGSKRSATWTLKVPVEQFRKVAAELAALGNTTRNSSDSQDVTEEFVDLLARIKN